MKTNELMHSPVVTCKVDDTLNEAARLMWDNDCGSLPVVDGGGKVVGMVTDRDLCMAAYTQGRPLWAIPVSSVMAKQVFSVGPDADVVDAQKVMSERQVRRIPIIDAEGTLVGMLSLNDLVRAAARAPHKDGMLRIVMTLAAAGAPRGPSWREAA
jgi:CBS domain-containing protein